MYTVPVAAGAVPQMAEVTSARKEIDAGNTCKKYMLNVTHIITIEPTCISTQHLYHQSNCFVQTFTSLGERTRIILTKYKCKSSFVAEHCSRKGASNDSCVKKCLTV